MWISTRCPLLRAALLHGGSGNRRDSSTREPELMRQGNHSCFWILPKNLHPVEKHIPLKNGTCRSGLP